MFEWKDVSKSLLLQGALLLHDVAVEADKLPFNLFLHVDEFRIHVREDV